MIEKIKHFFEEARVEFRHVNWPTRNEAIRLTAVVIGLSVGVALFLYAFDSLFTYGLKYFIQTFIARA
ncbi:MAG: preprotein translocase subunit SecE [Candidatus Liptonbacteria bacterium]